MNIKDLVEEAGYIPKQKATCHGGEYCSPCPFCKDGDDRFVIWPLRHNQNGSYMNGRYICRVCGRYGDAVTFLYELHGLRYLEACALLKLEPQKRIPDLPRKVFTPSTALEPSVSWIENATVFTDWCHLNLLKSPIFLAQVQKRGFNIESIKKYKLGFNPGNKNGRDFVRKRKDWGLKEDSLSQKIWIPTGIVIPSFNSDGQVIKLKIRRTTYETEIKDFEQAKLKEKTSKWYPQKYVVISGSKECLSIYGNSSLPCSLIAESELDALLILQEIENLAYCIALGGSTKTPDLQTHNLLLNTPKLFFCPDYDKAGAQAWIRWKRIYPNIGLLLTPSEKSPGDYFLMGGDLRKWLEDSLKSDKKSLNKLKWTKHD